VGAVGTRPDEPDDPAATAATAIVPVAGTSGTSGTASPSAPTPGRGLLRRMLRTAWPATRIVIGFGLVGTALWVLSSRRSELDGFGAIFRTLDWWWVGPAVVAEIGSYLCFAAMQFELLQAGHLRAPWTPWSR
jgi:hypothetical protein